MSDLISRLHRTALWPWLARAFSPYDAPEPQAAIFRARQVQALMRFAPLIVLANTLNAMLVVAAFWHRAPSRLQILLWAALVLAVCTQTWRAWWRARHRTPPREASRRPLRKATVMGTLMAALWSLPPLALFQGSDGPGQLLLAVVTTGMMCAGGFALSTIPAAGTAYVLVLGLASAFTIYASHMPLAGPLGGLLVVYMFIVLASVWASSNMLAARLKAEAEAERQNEVVGLLLRDFEENASDLLWEVDARGLLRHESPRLLSLLDLSHELRRSRPLVDLLTALVPDDSTALGQLANIREHLQRGVPFRDLPLTTARNGATRWWSVSAKPLHDARGRLVGWRGVASDVSAAQRANRQLMWMAHYDPLTGLANRHHFRQQVADLLAPAQGKPRPFALLCLDLDHFKTINDTLGHGVGDALLQEVARRLGARTRRSDTAARLGGDEFAILLRDVATREEAEAMTRRLLEGLLAPCEVQGARIAVRTSIGIAMAPGDAGQLDELLNCADLALYAAKSAGRGEFRFYAPQMAATTRRRLLIEQELRGALGRGELRLHYQPQVDLQAWQVTGFEALLRWRHAELGEVSPTEFVPVAEEAGLVPAIGEWVLRQACRDAARWPAPLNVCVNVSPAQAMTHDLVPRALGALNAAGLAPQRLELEITESLFVDESGATLSVLHALREAGLRIALDDFGTGYSSLAYLRRFPFDTLKIDSSFVRELMSRRDARAIVRMIVGLGRTLKMQVLAEGVEDSAQADVLREYGCQSLQGYLVARPMPPEDIDAFLAAWPLAPRPQGQVLATDMMPM